MSSTDPNTPWDDPVWREKGDNTWQRGLRLKQTWWREKRAQLSAGPVSTSNYRPVGSMLPLDVPLDVNLMTPEAVAAYHRARDDLRGRPGMIQEDRLRRNLLSSQPLAFNLFGYLAGHRDALLPWVRELDAAAIAIDDVQMEWAPKAGTIAGSAFDAIVHYSRADGERGFIGIEVKYNENLKQTLRAGAADKFVESTMDGGQWKAGAALALNKTGLRQFWYNQLLTQITQERGGHAAAYGVVIACAADESARQATSGVAEQLIDPAGLRFVAIEHLVSSVVGHEGWAEAFADRYLDFTPIAQHLSPADRRISHD